MRLYTGGFENDSSSHAQTVITFQPMQLEKLTAAARDMFGVDLSAEQRTAFALYAEELIAWNKARANLTAITDPEGIEIRHFLDSLSILRAVNVPPNARVIDVGTGAGFPGLPLKIIQPSLQLALLEATGKKIAFLEHLVGALKISGVSFVNLRAEEAGQAAAHRESYDLVLARAVAHMPILVEYLLPLCKLGGKCIAMKGESAIAEAHHAENALRVLGGKLLNVHPVELPGVAETHYLVVFGKVAATPPGFPRKPGIPSKKPL